MRQFCLALTLEIGIMSMLMANANGNRFRLTIKRAVRLFADLMMLKNVVFRKLAPF